MLRSQGIFGDERREKLGKSARHVAVERVGRDGTMKYLRQVDLVSLYVSSGCLPNTMTSQYQRKWKRRKRVKIVNITSGMRVP